MNYWILIDIVLLAVFTGCICLVARNGFVKTVAFCLACAIAAGTAGLIAKHTWQWGSEKIFTPLADKLLVKALGDPEESAMYSYLDTAVSTIETAYDKIKEKLLAKNNEDTEISNDKETAAEVMNPTDVKEDEKTSVEKISTLVGKYLSIILIFWILFALFLALLRVAIDELSFISRIPVIGFANQVLGVAAGIVLGYLVLAAPIYLIERFAGNLDIADANQLTSSFVINYIMKTLG